MGCNQSKEEDKDLSATERVMGGRLGIDKSERIARSKSEKQKITAKRKAALAAAADGSDEKIPPKLTDAGHLMAEEVAKRISGSIQSKEIVVGDVRSGKHEDLIRIRYAAL